MLEELKKQLATPQNIVIVSHYKPDGDAMGSSLGLYHYLLKKGHQVQVIVPSDYPQFLNFLPANSHVWVYQDSNKEKIQHRINEASFVFCLDFNSLSRIQDMEQMVEQAPAKKIMIDHHLDPSGFDDYRFWDSGACATSELIYLFIQEVFNDTHLIDKNIAECLYTGIVSDSGSFRFPSTRPIVHHIVSKLMETGFKHAEVHRNLFENQNANSLKFLGYCITEKLELFPEFHTAMMCISKQDLQQYHIHTGDTEGLVNVPMAIKDIKMSVVVIERQDKIKLSFRSKGDIPVNEICAKHFSGGGHKNASGGHSELTLEQTREKILCVLQEFASYLQA